MRITQLAHELEVLARVEGTERALEIVATRRAKSYHPDLADLAVAHGATWWQAVEKGLRLVRGTDDEAGRPATVAEVLTAYEQDLDTDGLSVPTPPAPANTCPLPDGPRSSPC